MRSSSEEWAPVVGYEGVYAVSTHGRVARVKGGQGAQIGIRAQYTHPNGYKQVALSMNNQAATKKVHRLVLEAFVGPCPPGMESLHGDDDPANNHVSNLRWGTHRENCIERESNGKPRKPITLRPTCRRGHLFPEAPLVDRNGNRDCVPCRKLRRLRARKTVDGFCRSGHEWTPENTYTAPSGTRQCRACRLAAENRRQQRRLLEKTGAKND